MTRETHHLRAYLSWIRQALPVWADRGFDAAAGRFRERLDGHGRPLDLPHRAMVQARQIYVFAHAARLGWFDGAALAEAAMASLRRDFVAEDDGQASVAFSIDPATGEVVSPVRDAYAHAFVLFSIAALYRLNGDPALPALADRIFRFVDREMTDLVHGGLFDALPAPPDKRQNPHMHLLEACLFLEEAAPGRGYAERASALVRLFRERFFKAGPGVLLEYFAADWVPAAGDKGRVWEPGHHFEWVWLLGEHERLAGEQAEPWLSTLYTNAVRHGLAPPGLIHDELTDDLVVLKPSHRVWPHTEAIKAAATRHAQGDPDAAALADVMAAGLLGTFLGKPFAGGWIDHVAPDGAPLVDYVPASSLYHLFLAAAEAAKTFLPSGPTAQPAA